MGAPLDNDPLPESARRVLKALLCKPFTLQMEGMTPSDVRGAIEEVEKRFDPPRPFTYRVRLTVIVTGTTSFGSRPSHADIQNAAVELARRGHFAVVSDPEAIDVP